MSRSAPPASAAHPEPATLTGDTVHAFQAMGGPCRFTLEGGATAAFTATAAAEAEVRRIEAKYSRYRADSVVSQLNAAAGGDAIEVDDETADLLDFAAEAWHASEGRFDITTGVLRRAWDFRVPRLPAPEAVQALLADVGWGRVEWQRPWLRLPRAGMEIDFGGLGKEYAADRAAVVLQQHGVRAALVNLGGDLRVLGPRADGRPWQLGVAHPRRPGTLVAAVALHAGALATSGDYERFIEVEGRRWCHLLDPRTGWPVQHWQSVSVVAPACLAAGALASVAMLSGSAAPALLEAEGAAWFAVDAAGAHHAGGGLFRPA